MRLIRFIFIAALCCIFNPSLALAEKQNTQCKGEKCIAIGNLNGNIINGYTIQQHEKILDKRLKEQREYLSLASNAEKKVLLKEIEAIEQDKRNLAQSHQAQLKELQRISAELAKYQASNPNISQSQWAAAQTALTKGNTQQADALFAQVEAAHEQAIVQTAAAAYQRGLIAEKEIRWQQAVTHFEKAQRLQPNNADYVVQLAWLYKLTGQYAQAAPLLTQAVHLAEQQHGNTSVQAATSYNNLAALYRAQGRYAEAEPLYKKAMDIFEKSLSADHPSLATSYNNLALLYCSQGRYAEAEPLYKKAIDIREKSLSADHPDLATSYNNLAALYRAQGRYAEAEPLCKKAIAIAIKALGKTHPHTKIFYSNYLGCLKEQGKNTQAAQVEFGM